MFIFISAIKRGLQNKKMSFCQICHKNRSTAEIYDPVKMTHTNMCEECFNKLEDEKDCNN